MQCIWDICSSRGSLKFILLLHFSHAIFLTIATNSKQLQKPQFWAHCTIWHIHCFLFGHRPFCLSISTENPHDFIFVPTSQWVVELVYWITICPSGRTPWISFKSIGRNAFFSAVQYTSSPHLIPVLDPTGIPVQVLHLFIWLLFTGGPSIR